VGLDPATNTKLFAGSFASLIARHPEEIEHISGDHRVAQEQRGSAGRKKLVHTPSNESRSQQEALKQSRARRPQTELKERECSTPEQQRERTQPSMCFRRNELVTHQQHTGCNQGNAGKKVRQLLSLRRGE
jgi:hypothetical protein